MSLFQDFVLQYEAIVKYIYSASSTRNISHELPRFRDKIMETISKYENANACVNVDRNLLDP